MRSNLIFVYFAATIFSMYSSADENLSGKQKQYYDWIIQKSGETGAEIISGDRTPESQVTVMWNNCVNKSGGENCKKEFLAPGYNKICSEFILDVYDSGLNRATNIANMSAALAEGLKKLGSTRPCMQHVIVPGIERINRAIDVSAKSVKNHAKFYDAVMHEESCADKSRFFYPDIPGKPKSSTPDRAFHLEFRLDDSCQK